LKALYAIRLEQARRELTHGGSEVRVGSSNTGSLAGDLKYAWVGTPVDCDGFAPKDQ
jgi:hypothetical protein